MNCLKFSDSLEIIIISHRGSPIDRVNIKCLVILSVYEFSPTKFVIMIKINRDETVVIIPFSIFICVRINCDVIVDFMVIRNVFVWFEFQNISCIIRITGIDMVMVRCVGKSWLNAMGSKEEKISGIMWQNMECCSHLEL